MWLQKQLVELYRRMPRILRAEAEIERL